MRSSWSLVSPLSRGLAQRRGTAIWLGQGGPLSGPPGTLKCGAARRAMDGPLRRGQVNRAVKMRRGRRAHRQGAIHQCIRSLSVERDAGAKGAHRRAPKPGASPRRSASIIPGPPFSAGRVAVSSWVAPAESVLLWALTKPPSAKYRE